MNHISAQEIQQYLVEQDFLKPDELAKRTGTTSDQILALEEAQCIPAASYVVEGEMAVTSSFGTYHQKWTPSLGQ